MKDIIAETDNLTEEVNQRMGDFSVDPALIRSLETFNSPLEYIKQ